MNGSFGPLERDLYKVLAIDLPRARRLAFGVVLGQAAVTGVAALAAWGLGGEGAALSALLGGGIATMGSLAMAVLVFARTAADAQRVVASFYVGEAVKIALIAAAFAAVLATVRVVPLAMLAGFAVTYLVYWIALLAALPRVA
ncbi:MAG TPA: ATP synthase subunit I [Steroidobacteraceae bacterium]|nr:ATP synthase subunit I [Steroidobacteraceae bacterium]